MKLHKGGNVMSDTQDNNSKFDISPEDVFKPTKADAAHSGLKLALSTLPLASDIFELGDYALDTPMILC
jgi:hypothetical protein